MATFERGTSLSSEARVYQKYPLRRLEPAIKKFLKVIEIDLARLWRHQQNVERYNQRRDWKSLHTEHINATRTVQQIKANITEIEKSRLQVQDNDLASFDKKIEVTKVKAISAVEEFIDLAATATKKSPDTPSNLDSSPHADLTTTSMTLECQGNGVYGNQMLQMNQLPENTEVVESWDNLQENLEDLNSMIHQFASLVDEQQEKVDNIENNIEKAHSSVNQGAKQLGKALTYKAAMFPVVGAVIGTVVAGPVGLIAGAKLGGVLGVVGGGAMGFFSGKFLKKRSDKATEIEMSKLSRSNSLPDLRPDSTEDSWVLIGRKRNQSNGEMD